MKVNVELDHDALLELFELLVAVSERDKVRSASSAFDRVYRATKRALSNAAGASRQHVKSDRSPLNEWLSLQERKIDALLAEESSSQKQPQVSFEEPPQQEILKPDPDDGPVIDPTYMRGYNGRNQRRGPPLPVIPAINKKSAPKK